MKNLFLSTTLLIGCFAFASTDNLSSNERTNLLLNEVIDSQNIVELKSGTAWFKSCQDLADAMFYGMELAGYSSNEIIEVYNSIISQC